MKPLKDFYKDMGVNSPGGILPREELLYSKLTQETLILSEGLEAKDKEAIALKEDLKKKDKEVWNHNSLLLIFRSLNIREHRFTEFHLKI